MRRLELDDEWADIDTLEGFRERTENGRTFCTALSRANLPVTSARPARW